MAFLDKVDKNSKEVARDVHCLIGPRSDAELGALLFEKVMGAPVERPTDEEAQLEGKCMSGILEKHAKILAAPGVTIDEEVLEPSEGVEAFGIAPPAVPLAVAGSQSQDALPICAGPGEN